MVALGERIRGKLWDEQLGREVFETFMEARVLIKRWQRHYNTVSQHSSHAYRPRRPGCGEQQAEYSDRHWYQPWGQIRTAP